MSEASKPSDNRQIESGGNAAVNKLSDKNGASDEPKTPLTPEEQMALYEKDLKENDWGHQPC